MKHIIRYRRPFAPWILEHMTTPDAESAILQVKRLTSLGYSVVETDPSLEIGPDKFPG